MHSPFFRFAAPWQLCSRRRRRRARTRSGTSPSTGTRASRSQEATSTSAMRSTSPRSRLTNWDRRSGRPGYPARSRAGPRADARRTPDTSPRGRVPSRVAPGRGRPEDPATRRRLSRAGDGTALAFRDTSFPGRIGWREVTVSARDGGRVVASDVPATSASAALRKYPSDLLRSPLDISAASAGIELGSKAAAAADDRRSRCAATRGGRVRGTDRGGRPLDRRAASVSSDRSVLGRGARSHAGTRQGDGRRVPRRNEGDAASRVHARRDGHDRAHRRSLRARVRDSRPVGVHRPRAALPLAHARLGPTRRPRRRLRSAPEAPCAPACPTTTTTDTTTITTTTTTTR